MSRIIVSVILALVVISVCVIESFYIDYCSNTLIDMANKTIEAYELNDKDGANKSAQQANDFLDKHKNRLSVFIDHSILSELNMTAARLKSLATAGEMEELFVECSLMLVMIKSINDDEKISITSLF